MIIYTKRFAVDGEWGDEDDNGDGGAGSGDSHYVLIILMTANCPLCRYITRYDNAT